MANIWLIKSAVGGLIKPAVGAPYFSEEGDFVSHIQIVLKESLVCSARGYYIQW